MPPNRLQTEFVHVGCNRCGQRR